MITAFVRVNIDDELYESSDGGGGSSHEGGLSMHIHQVGLATTIFTVLVHLYLLHLRGQRSGAAAAARSRRR